MRRATILAVALLLAGCGGKKAEPSVMFTPIPVYPGATDARDDANSTFATRDWTLPQGTLPSQVYAWYQQRLPRAGWKITDKNETGVRAHRGNRSLSIGVRGRTLEAISS